MFRDPTPEMQFMPFVANSKVRFSLVFDCSRELILDERGRVCQTTLGFARLWRWSAGDILCFPTDIISC